MTRACCLLGLDPEFDVPPVCPDSFLIRKECALMIRSDEGWKIIHAEPPVLECGQYVSRLAQLDKKSLGLPDAKTYEMSQDAIVNG